jgi:hypothetical protein
MEMKRPRNHKLVRDKYLCFFLPSIGTTLLMQTCAWVVIGLMVLSMRKGKPVSVVKYIQKNKDKYFYSMPV